MPIRAIHFLNQFFGGIGGEEAADSPLVVLDGPRGPGQALMRLVPDIEIVATIVAGDNYVAEHTERAVAEALELIEALRDRSPVDVLVAGPAFIAGRYGIACSAICAGVESRLGIPAVTALHPENPALDTYRHVLTAVRAGRDVMDMQHALEAMGRVGIKRARGETLGPEDALLEKGLRSNYVAERSGAQRAITMLLAKLSGAPYVTEYAMPEFDRVAPAPPIEDASRAVIAMVTTGGIVPRGNPDHIESASASRYGAYDISGLDRLSAATHVCVHGGYDPTYANEDPNRVLPLDQARVLERSGRIGRLHNTYYATVGNGTSVGQARRFGTEIAPLLVNEGVQAVILTST